MPYRQKRFEAGGLIPPRADLHRFGAMMGYDVIQPLMSLRAPGSTSASGAVAAHPIEKKASAKKRRQPPRRSAAAEWLRLACTRKPAAGFAVAGRRCDDKRRSAVTCGPWPGRGNGRLATIA